MPIKSGKLPKQRDEINDSLKKNYGSIKINFFEIK